MELKTTEDILYEYIDIDTYYGHEYNDGENGNKKWVAVEDIEELIDNMIDTYKDKNCMPICYESYRLIGVVDGLKELQQILKTGNK